MERLGHVDALRVQLRDIQRDMKGINPKLSIYKRMERECESITRELEARTVTTHDTENQAVGTGLAVLNGATGA